MTIPIEGLVDKNGCKIRVGDTLQSDFGYKVIVEEDDNGKLYGQLVCATGHSCADIPYSIDTETHTLVKE